MIYKTYNQIIINILLFCQPRFTIALEKDLKGGDKMSQLGEFLKELRGNKSIREVAKGIGISHTYLSTLEKGYDPRTKKERKPTFEVLSKLAKYYNVSSETLMHKAGYTDLDPLKSFGENLKILRGEQPLEKVAKETNISEKYLKRLEEGLPGNQRPTISNVIKLAEYFNVRISNFAFLAGYDETDIVKERVGIDMESPADLDIRYRLVRPDKDAYYNGIKLTEEERNEAVSILDNLFKTKCK
ncbi:helix-turn-helix domain-containing protein [Virgibacillus dokdonensis]|uniref:helix-turn-helix domain-containing protein n=1 Tax=Virgibacillus dokdonensis TaxID=302167 RepID=UPI0015908261|nr:helix-turn-helix transcriptional regulator [Virgibacillus dokdonensis]